MKVILTEKVPFLGNVGEIVNVSSGHARNYLVPKKLAVLADESNRKKIDDNTRRLAKKIDEQKKSALELKGKLDGVKLEITKKVGGSGKLFGSITNTELSNALAKHGIAIERRLIVTDAPIKNLGLFDVRVKLFQDVEAQLHVNVVIDPHQAKEMKEKQIQAEKRAIERKQKEAEMKEQGIEVTEGSEEIDSTEEDFDDMDE